MKLKIFVWMRLVSLFWDMAGVRQVDASLEFKPKHPIIVFIQFMASSAMQKLYSRGLFMYTSFRGFQMTISPTAIIIVVQTHRATVLLSMIFSRRFGISIIPYMSGVRSICNRRTSTSLRTSARGHQCDALLEIAWLYRNRSFSE